MQQVGVFEFEEKVHIVEKMRYDWHEKYNSKRILPIIK